MTVEGLTGSGVETLDRAVRGDPITGDRYYSKRWARAEWEHVWTKVWHIGGMASDLYDPGDFLTQNIGRESVVMLKQEDGSVRAFYNACKHRGNRLAWAEVGGAPFLVCSYHGWKYAPDGTLASVQDPDDFAAGSPCGKVSLEEIPCVQWGGFVWFNMDRDAAPLGAWLGPMAELLDQWKMERMTRVLALAADVPCNWKVIRDNFNESYHLPTLHPQIADVIDDALESTVFEMYPGGHNRMIMQGLKPSGRYPSADIVEAPLAEALRFWGLDPADFEGKASRARSAIITQKRRLYREKGHPHYEGMEDSALVDYHHCTLFPNITFTMWPDGVQLLRSEPHPTDPERCIFDHWFMAHRIGDSDAVIGPMGPVAFRHADRETVVFGEKSLGDVADQDLSVAIGQQQGLHSRGYTGGILTGQEKRVQSFHEQLNDMCGIHD